MKKVAQLNCEKKEVCLTIETILSLYNGDALQLEVSRVGEKFHFLNLARQRRKRKRCVCVALDFDSNFQHNCLFGGEENLFQLVSRQGVAKEVSTRRVGASKLLQ